MTLVPPPTCRNARKRVRVSGFIPNTLKDVSIIGTPNPITQQLLLRRRLKDGRRLLEKVRAARARAKVKVREEVAIKVTVRVKVKEKAREKEKVKVAREAKEAKAAKAKGR